MDKKERAKQLFEILKKAHDLYNLVDDSGIQSGILDGVEPVIQELGEMGVNKTWLVCLVIWGKEFFRSEKDKMNEKEYQTDDERQTAFGYGKKKFFYGGIVTNNKQKEDELPF